MGLLVWLGRRGIRLVWLLALLGGILPATAATYYVANSGSDDNAGTDPSLPFRTLTRANSILAPGDTCLIRGGLYREALRPQVSGTSNAPITFAAFPNEAVTITGANLVSHWVPWSNGIFMAPVAANLGTGHDQVFVDGEMVPQSSFPQPSRKLLAPATVSVQIDNENPNIITSSAFGGRPENYWAGAWFCGALGVRWSWQCAQVVSSSGNSITVEEATRSKPWFSGEGVGYLWGSLRLLDSDNEWQLQGSPNGLYLCLRLSNKESPATHTVEMKRRDWCVDISGKNYIVVRGLFLRAGAVRLHGNGNVLEDCNASFLSHFMNYEWGYSHDGGRPSGAGILLDGKSNVVRRCVIHDTAGSGVISRGEGNLILRNLIYNTDYSGTYGCAIRLEGQQHQVAFNTAHSSGRDILQPGGTGHNIAFNDLSHPGLMCRDLGVIYIWGTSGMAANGRRTRIAYNWLHDNVGFPGTCPLVYLDNYSREFVVDHNVLWNCNNDAGIRINGPASGHRLYNNTLFNCENLGTHTYDMWPANNPDPLFWSSDIYHYLQANNLFLSGSPQTCLRDWRNLDFRPLPNSVALGTGKVIAGYSETLNRGAYESPLHRWTPGIRGVWLSAAPVARFAAPEPSPDLQIGHTGHDGIRITAPVTAASFQLCVATNLRPPVVWSAVTNVPSITSTQWSVTLPIVREAEQWFRLENRE